jgi:hypothetical protein
MKKALSLLFVSFLCACTSGEASPSQGTYTVTFPSTAAAIATDFVQIFAYDFKPEERTFACADLVAARLRKDNSAKPVVQGPQVNVCELLGGARPITLPYGEKAVLAVGIRRTGSNDDDFLIGCVIQTFGNGNALLAIPLELVDVQHDVPTSNCKSVGDRCSNACTAQ